MNRRNGLSVAGIAAAVLGAAIVAEALVPIVAVPPEARPVPAKGVAPPQAASAPPVDNAALIEKIMARPLFAPDRRPPATGSAEVADTGADSNLTRLMGIAVTGQGPVALFQVSDRPKPVPAHPGDVVGGWRVEAILPGEVRLSGNGTTKSMVPTRNAGPPTPGGLPPGFGQALGEAPTDAGDDTP